MVSLQAANLDYLMVDEKVGERVDEWEQRRVPRQAAGKAACWADGWAASSGRLWAAWTAASSENVEVVCWEQLRVEWMANGTV